MSINRIDTSRKKSHWNITPQYWQYLICGENIGRTCNNVINSNDQCIKCYRKRDALGAEEVS